MKKGTVKVKFSNGFGNNLFQYSFGKLLSDHHGLNYDHPAIPELGIRAEKHSFNKNLKTVKFHAASNLEAKKYDTDHLKWFDDKYKNYNFNFYSFIFYFEDYNIYKSNIEKVRSFFPSVKKKNKKDLVLHFRLENRVVQSTHYKNMVKPSVYKKVISENFDFDRLYIVTDSERWGHVKEKHIRKLHDKYKNRLTSFVPIKDSIRYMNNLVDAFSEFNPKVVHHKNLIDDFNFIRSFDKIMFKNSTFSWWASVLSDASQVGVFGPWKPNKGKRNRNLGRMNLPGWFSWGKEKDLLNG